MSHYNIALADKRIRAKTITQGDLDKVQSIYNQYISQGAPYADNMIANLMQSLTNKQIAACYKFLQLNDMENVKSVKRANQQMKNKK